MPMPAHAVKYISRISVKAAMTALHCCACPHPPPIQCTRHSCGIYSMGMETTGHAHCTVVQSSPRAARESGLALEIVQHGHWHSAATLPASWPSHMPSGDDGLEMYKSLAWPLQSPPFRPCPLSRLPRPRPQARPGALSHSLTSRRLWGSLDFTRAWRRLDEFTDSAALMILSTTLVLLLLTTVHLH